jgi:hypothetical protein
MFKGNLNRYTNILSGQTLRKNISIGKFQEI